MLGFDAGLSGNSELGMKMEASEEESHIFLVKYYNIRKEKISFLGKRFQNNLMKIDQ